MSPDELLAAPSVAELVHGIALSQRFHFYLVIAPRSAVDPLLDLVASRVEAKRGARPRVVRVAPAAATSRAVLSLDQLRALVLPRLATPTAADSAADVITVVDATGADPSDDKVWTGLFETLNERRNVVAQALHGALMLCLPPRLEQAFAFSAPDFWSIRSLAVRIDTPAARSPAAPLPDPAVLSRPVSESHGLLDAVVPPASSLPRRLEGRGARALFVVSDLLLSPTTPSHVSAAIAEFLRWIPAQRPPAESHLVLAGNTLDFTWLALRTDLDAGTESADVEYARHTMLVNAPVFDALARFVASRGRLTLLVGSQDAELSFPAVRELLFERLGDGLVELLGDGQALSVGDVIVERADRYDPWNTVPHDDLRQLRSQLSRRGPSQGYDPRSLGRRVLEEVVLPLTPRYRFLPLLAPRIQASLPLLALLEPQTAKQVAALVDASRIQAAHGASASLGVPGPGLSDHGGLKALLRSSGPQGARSPARLLTVALEPLRGAAELDAAPDREDAGTLRPAFPLLARGYKVVVFGHTRRAKQVALYDGTYLNCGAWVELVDLPRPGESSSPDDFSLALALADGETEAFVRFSPTFCRVEFTEAGEIAAARTERWEAGFSMPIVYSYDRSGLTA